ncbi:hypothetical protein Tco_0559287 [Tanacetum coccineum]|uniref:Uncharacterized protein n=1 Tax=Tanacetum coccineum TaxID=301880 RepID=A0ABQ5D4H8_9ASTR
MDCLQRIVRLVAIIVGDYYMLRDDAQMRGYHECDRYYIEMRRIMRRTSRALQTHVDSCSGGTRVTEVAWDARQLQSGVVHDTRVITSAISRYMGTIGGISGERELEAEEMGYSVRTGRSGFISNLYDVWSVIDWRNIYFYAIDNDVFIGHYLDSHDVVVNTSRNCISDQTDHRRWESLSGGGGGIFLDLGMEVWVFVIDSEFYVLNEGVDADEHDVGKRADMEYKGHSVLNGGRRVLGRDILLNGVNMERVFGRSLVIVEICGVARVVDMKLGRGRDVGGWGMFGGFGIGGGDLGGGDGDNLGRSEWHILEWELDTCESVRARACVYVGEDEGGSGDRNWMGSGRLSWEVDEDCIIGCQEVVSGWDWIDLISGIGTPIMCEDVVGIGGVLCVGVRTGVLGGCD